MSDLSPRPADAGPVANAGEASVQPLASLTAVVHQRLRSDLMQGRWAPGAKLRMHQLRQAYESGASPLREALSRLVTEGLVVHNDQRGFAAAAVSAAELDDIVRTRIALESLALAQGFERRSAQWEETLVLALHRLSRTPRSLHSDRYEENPQWESCHRAFHEALVAGCGSLVLQDFCGQLYDRAYRYRQLAAHRAYPQRNEGAEHRAILEAVLAGQLQQAQQLLEQHYRRTADVFTEAG